MSDVTRCEPGESSDMSRTDTAELKKSDSENFCLWTDLWDKEDCLVPNAGSIVTIVYASRTEIVWAP